MQRRSHKKSRRGCADCKRRHIKCDETQPACTNCTAAGLHCAFVVRQPPQPNNIRFVATSTPNSSESPGNLSTSHSPVAKQSTLVPSANLLHLELFHYFTDVAGHLILTRYNAQSLHPSLIKTALASQFLMTQVLALSALHLSLRAPERTSLLRDEAAKLQEEALLLFNGSVKTINEDNVKPAFLYSGLLGLHFFSNTFSTPSENIEIFLDRLVQSISLMRGVLAILSSWMDFLMATDFREMLEEGKTQMDRGMVPDANDKTVAQFEQMGARIASSNLNPADIKVCQASIQQLSRIWWSEVGIEGRNCVPNARMVTSWPVMVSAEFTDLLMRRKPEAVAILGYYAVLLHECNEFWAVGNGGHLLLGYVGEYLGPEWDSWLAWPRSVIYG